MQIPAKFTTSDLREAFDAADVAASEKFRPYLPGRLLPVLLARFRDDVTEALGNSLPNLPQRPPVRPARLDELTSHEFAALLTAVSALTEKFTVLMDDPKLVRQLEAFQERLLAEKADREAIQARMAMISTKAS